jgi:hypothetical protein
VTSKPRQAFSPTSDVNQPRSKKILQKKLEAIVC